MVETSKRKHPRIPYRGKVDLLFPEIEYLNCETLNISLVGIRVRGCQEQEEGTPCDIEFHDTDDGSATHRLSVKGEVVRINEDGIALLFLDMNVRTFNDLEEIIQCNAGDTFLGDDEFLDQNTADQPAM